MQTNAIVFTGVHQVAIVQAEVPEPGPGQVLVQTRYSGISPGTELRCLAGKQPEAKPWPFIPGYSQTGVIVAVGTGVTLPLGTAVYCGGTAAALPAPMWGGHVAHALRDESQVIPLPAGIDLLDAALTHMLAIAYHGLRMAKPLPHEQVAVIGLGLIGQLAARFFTAAGAQVLAVDRIAQRVALAQQGGVTAQVADNLVATVRTHFAEGVDIIVDATGAAAVLPLAIELARDLPWDDTPRAGTRYVVQGSYPAEFAVPYQDAFRKELTFLLPRDMQRRDAYTGLDLLARKRITVRELIGRVAAPEQAPEVYVALREPDAPLVTAVFDWA